MGTKVYARVIAVRVVNGGFFADACQRWGQGKEGSMLVPWELAYVAIPSVKEGNTGGVRDCMEEGIRPDWTMLSLLRVWGSPLKMMPLSNCPACKKKLCTARLGHL